MQICAPMRTHKSYTRALAIKHARIFMKFATFAHKMVIDDHIELHEDPSFRCRDICKTILAFVYSLIFNVFRIFSQFRTSKVFKDGKLLNE